MMQEKLTALLSSKGYSSRTHNAGIQIPETIFDSGHQAKTQLGQNTIEFFSDNPSLKLKGGCFQFPLLKHIYYDPNSQDVLYRVAAVMSDEFAIMADVLQRKPVSEFIDEIENDQSNPMRPVAAACKWLSKLLPK